MLEYLGILGIGWGIKKAADGVQSATNRGVRKATKAIAHAAETVTVGACAHRDEVTHDDGARVEVRCKKCGRTASGVA